jgi:hypothetical protein
MIGARPNETPERRGADMTSDGSGLDRRRFLQVGGISIGLVALTAACVNTHENDQITQTGTRIPAPSTSVPPFPGSAMMDAQLVLTALSVEKLAVETYDAVLKETWITAASTIDAARKVQANHRAHVTELSAQAAALGQDAAAVGPNAGVKEDTVDSELEAVKEAPTASEKSQLAAGVLTGLEDALAQLYTKAGGEMTTSDLRKRMVSIGAATARQYTVLAKPAGFPMVPLAFMPSAASAIPEDDWVTAKPGANAPGTTAGTR